MYKDEGGYIGMRRNQQYYSESASKGFPVPQDMRMAHAFLVEQPDPYVYRAFLSPASKNRLELAVSMLALSTLEKRCDVLETKVQDLTKPVEDTSSTHTP